MAHEFITEIFLHRYTYEERSESSIFTEKELEKQGSFSQFFNIVLVNTNELDLKILIIASISQKKYVPGLRPSPPEYMLHHCFQNDNYLSGICVEDTKRC